MPDLATKPAHRPFPNQPATTTGIPVNGIYPSGTPGPKRVFTGDWLLNGCACHIYSEGYTGELLRLAHGWAVFRVTRLVAQAIVAGRQRAFHQIVTGAIAAGAPAAAAWLDTQNQMAAVTWHAGMIVVDSRALASDPEMVEIAIPDDDGCYTIGWGWMWDNTDAGAVHTVHGASQ